MSQAEVIHTGAMRRVGWVRVTYGRHVRAGAAEHAVLLAWQDALPPTAVFTGLTAARVRGWWLPELPPAPVFAVVRRGEGRSRRSGLRLARVAATPAFDLLDGLRLAPPAATLLACACLVSDLDLLILLDGARAAGAAPLELASAAKGSARGAPALRRAWARSTGRAESPWESVLTLLCVTLDVAVVAQHEVRDADGCLLARGDLWLVGTRTLLEYDGAGHRDPRRQRADLRRDRRLGAAGWRRIAVTRADLVHQAPALVREILAAVGREWTPSAVAAWHEVLCESCLTPGGRARLARRWEPRRMPPVVRDGTDDERGSNDGLKPGISVVAAPSAAPPR